MDVLVFGIVAGLLFLAVSLPEPYITFLEYLIWVVTVANIFIWAFT